MSASDPKRTFRQSTLEVSCWFIKSKQLSEASILRSVAPLLERETATSRTELAPDLPAHRQLAKTLRSCRHRAGRHESRERRISGDISEVRQQKKSP